jgi:AcrR family transcriptional regulator
MMDAANVKPARERILDAAAAVMRTRGLANATTKAIAAEAGYSEAMLYKHFDDKQQLFLAVLLERMQPAAAPIAAPGVGDLRENLTAMVRHLMDYFARLFPMAGSIFGAPELLALHREGVAHHGGAPDGPIRMLRGYLEAERAAGRLSGSADVDALARLLVGAAFQQGFLAAFAGRETVADAGRIARRLVAVAVP